MTHYLSTDSWKETVKDHSILLGEPPEHSVRTIALSELHDEAACREYISWFQEYIDAPDMKVAASMLAKRIGYLWTAPLVTAMTFHHQHVSFQLENSFLYHPALSDHEGGTRFPFLAVNGLQAEGLAGDRAVWREKVVEEMFAVQLTPLLKTLAVIAPLSMSILWENIMVRIGRLYTTDENETEQEREQIQADFAYLTQVASGQIFGVRKNPLTRFTECKDNGYVAKSERITCCFYYQMSGEYCRKCPKIDNENKSQLK
ncbi:MULTISPECIES: IucA/IucC family C-terminal-domain containing protein [unclassified Paenibacillus]|uniref:IucA/IucC family C-terminal-domain containing protein n=1 Tax=unclassified Paenibacillus TaxID=185978 RepID=UPI0009A5E9A1|nr:MULTISPECIES: IucA/IucC family C-terminal-domain containing protein [unclassified Paenibacillus]SLK04530.1 Ferric iron reductase protein FhuF, involved in iron transport [Paenibacillus sp. RU5A]SOC69761.1 Ferric iron reductase protein FhuF, involved in iron transport [Paenibacillus sp. RU26A]SOC72111.1 Ferric iron reductase protein FhuF, involved in iron transport [Paenibacillus sp. RU5M]